MNPIEAETLIDKLIALSEYYEKPKSEAQLGIYLQGLSDLSLPDVLNAINAFVKDKGVFFPKVCELRALVQGTTDNQADAAWAEMLAEIRRVGYTGKPALPDATWEVIAELWGSWRNLCETLPNEGPEFLGWAKRFRSAYGSGQRVAARLALPLATKELGE